MREVGSVEGDDGLSVEVFEMADHILDVGGRVDEVVVAGEEEEGRSREECRRFPDWMKFSCISHF